MNNTTQKDRIAAPSEHPACIANHSSENSSVRWGRFIVRFSGHAVTCASRRGQHFRVAPPWLGARQPHISQRQISSDMWLRAIYPTSSRTRWTWKSRIECLTFLRCERE